MKKPINFTGHRKLYVCISLSILAVALVFNIIFGTQMDIAFKGGTLMRYSYSGTVDMGQVEKTAQDVLGSSAKAVIDTVNNTSVISISLTDDIDTDKQKELTDALQKALPDNEVVQFSSNSLKASMGRQFFIKCLVTLLLAGGNLVFNVSAGTDTVSVETEKSGIEKNADPEKNNVPDYAPFSEMVTMQKTAETQDEGGVTENTDTEDSVDEEEKADAETNDEPAMENSGQVSETTDDGITSDNNGSVSSYESLPAGVPYTSGFSTASGVASIVAPGGGDEESRVLYDNGDGTYSDYYGSRYSYQGDGNWADANGNSYRTWNDEDYYSGNQLEQHELQGSNGTVTVKETTNGDYYYCDADGVGYTDNGDGTWTDENGNIYTE